MNELQIVGLLVVGAVTLGGFIALIWKIMQPINELRVVIQKLNDTIDSLTNDNNVQNKRLDKHGVEIDNLNQRVGNLETRVDIYHNSRE